jgi:hypothetical protein
MEGVATVAREPALRLIEPLLRAGMDLGEIRTRLTRLAFDCIVEPGPAALSSAARMVEDQPPEVRRAWAETVGRMLELEDAEQDG